jgi:hypothetical protein
MDRRPCLGSARAVARVGEPVDDVGVGHPDCPRLVGVAVRRWGETIADGGGSVVDDVDAGLMPLVQIGLEGGDAVERCGPPLYRNVSR